MAGTRNFSIRTPLQRVSQTTDATRPSGLTAAVPVRLYRDFVGKTTGGFRTTPTSASMVRSKNHKGLQSFFFQDWATIFGQEEYGSYSPPVEDTGAGEFTNTQYNHVSAIGGGIVQADSRLIGDDIAMTDTSCFVLDTKLSRDGRYTYIMNAANSSGTAAAIYINVFDNLTGAQLSPTLNSSPLTGGKIDMSGVVGPIVAADGNIAVVDDSTGQDAANHMAFNSALFAFQIIGLTGGTYTTATWVYRYDFAANNIEILDAGHDIVAATPTYTPRAFANVQLAVQTSTLVGVVAYRVTFTAGPPDTGQVQFAELTSWTGGAAPTVFGRSISSSPVIDFTSPPTTAVSRRGSIDATRRFYFYYFLSTGSPSLVWIVINPDPSGVFWSGGVVDQNVAGGYAPSGTTYLGMKAAPLPSSFVHSGSPCMAVAFVYMNTSTNFTEVRAFIHTTSTSADVGGTIVGLAAASGIINVFEVGVGVPVDSAGDPARFMVAFNNPNTNYSHIEVRCTDETNLSALTATVEITNAGVTNAALNATSARRANRFAFAMSMWNDTSGSFAVNKNDIQAITFLKSDTTAVFLRVVAPFVAIGLVWDADLYENLPNPTDAGTNQRVTTFYARGTGANDGNYVAGALLAGFRTSPGYNALGDGSNSQDLTGSFAPTTASPDTLAHAALETAPAIAYPGTGGGTAFSATMNDEFTFAVSSWGLGPQLPEQVQPGMTIVLTSPAFAVGRYTINTVTYDPVAEAVTVFSVSQPIPFLAAATIYTGYVSVGPSTSIRQLLLPTSANYGNNRQGNVIFPSIVQLDYVNIETLATNSEICELTVDTTFGVVPVGVHVELRGYNFNNTTIPSNQAAGIEVSVSLDAGTTWLTKVLSTLGTSTISGPTTSTSFGVQSFVGSGWGAVPAGVHEGDFLLIETGPNEGMYSISGTTNDPGLGARIYVDRPFPVPGNATISSYVICSAKDDYQDDGIGGDGYGILGMEFDVTSLPFTTDVMHVRIECKDQVAGHAPTYEFDSITAQWEP